MKQITIALLACLVVAGCGHHTLSGTYLPKGGGVGNGIAMEKLEFGSGDQVIVTMLEQKFQVSYKIDGKHLLLSLNGQQLVFDILDDGCIDGGGNFGKFCKG
jgi:hypothetical protein